MGNGGRGDRGGQDPSVHSLTAEIDVDFDTNLYINKKKQLAHRPPTTKLYTCTMCNVHCTYEHGYAEK